MMIFQALSRALGDFSFKNNPELRAEDQVNFILKILACFKLRKFKLEPFFRSYLHVLTLRSVTSLHRGSLPC